MIAACAVNRVADCRVLAVLADHALCAEPEHGREETPARAGHKTKRKS